MDPVTVGLLGALAGGAGGEVGRQAWSALSALVRRPFGRGVDGGGNVAVGSGEPELMALAQTPADASRAEALSEALAARAAVDDEFRAALRQWHEGARLVRGGDGHVQNNISGGTQNAPVLQGRDFSGTSFSFAPPISPGGTASDAPGAPH